MFRGCAAVTIVLMALTACGESVPREEGDTEPLELPSPSVDSPSDPSPMPPEEISVALLPVNESGVSADAILLRDQELMVVVIEAEGIPAPGEYPAHLHVGQCRGGGEAVVELNPVIGLPDGTGESTTTLEGDAFDPATPHFIQMHGAGTAPLACGDLPLPLPGNGAVR
jgi:hypothetical protein